MTRLQFIDDTIELDNLLIKQISGKAAVTRFGNILLSKLPTKETAVAPELVLQRIQQLVQSDVYRLAPVPAQSLADVLLAKITQICSDSQVTINLQRSDANSG